VKRAFSLGCAILTGALAACQQTWVLDDLPPDASRSGTGGNGAGNGRDGGGKGGFTPSDASADGRCTQGPQLQYKGDVPQVVVVLDRSTPMYEPFDSNGHTPLYSALGAISSEVSKYGGGHNVAPSIDFAFLDFPDTASDCSAMTGCCPSDATLNYMAFELQADCSTSEANQCLQSSLRPTASALNAAQRAFASFGGSPPRAAERYILLITADDPDPTCSPSCYDAEEAVTNPSGISAAATTAIVALASSSQCLVDVANAQRSSSSLTLYNTASPSNFGDVITIVDDIAQDGCKLSLTTPPTSSGVSVYLGGQEKLPDTGSGNGWVYDSTDNPQRVILHGTLCTDYLMSSPGTTFGLVIYDGCGPTHVGQNP
jgi:hypothetical protein